MLSTGQHTLTTQPDNNDSYKHCILVKLTDSSAKAIEEYIRNKNNISKKPTITFQKDKGEIHFPIVNEGSQSKKLYFSLSSVKESNQSASFECIAFTNSKLITIGNIEQKLAIQANVEESFKDTKEKMNNVAEEEKKNALIELKSGVHPTLNRSKQNTPIFSQSNSKVITQVKTETETNKPKNDRSLRERVIHLLAFKSYPKAVLLLRLNKFSLTEKEKESLDSIIQSVATLNQKNSCYELNNDILLNEVKEDWPFFSEQEQLVVKRSIAKARSNNSNPPPQPIPSQAATHQSKQISSISSSNAFNSLNSNNKQTSSAFVSIQQSSNTNSNKSNDSLNLKKFSQSKPVEQNNLKTKREGTPPKQAKITSSPDSDDLLNDCELSFKSNGKKTLDDVSNLSAKKFKVNESELLEKSEMLELSKKYTRILSDKQMEQYKNDFNQMHDEYIECHNYIDKTSKIWQAYKDTIESIDDKNSKEYDEKKRIIFKEYTCKINDADYIKVKDRYDKLICQLNFIQELIKQYQSVNP